MYNTNKTIIFYVIKSLFYHFPSLLNLIFLIPVEENCIIYSLY